MAYQQSSVTAITDIPALVAVFAAANGWTVSGQNYKVGSGVEFTLAAAISGYDHTLTWTKTSDSRVTSGGRIASPKLNGTVSVPTVSIPSSVHLFAAATHLAIVVEYGFNSYRHLYLGYAEKHGSYGGGEVVSGTHFPASSDTSAYPMNYRHNNARYLFGARSQFDVNNCGGILVDHADNATKWRRFYGPLGISSLGAFAGTEALGGFKDDINDAYIARGRNTYAGSNLLVPINLYAAQGSGGSVAFVPLGCPAGVRAVNLIDIDPKESIIIATDEWMCFPAASKSVSDTVAKSTSGWGAGETSGMVGYAYRKN